MEMEDGGFTEQVMLRLPATPAVTPAKSRSDRYVWMSHLWTAACLLIGFILLTVTDGWTAIRISTATLIEPFITPTGFVTAAACIVIGFLWLLAEVLRRERVFAL